MSKDYELKYNELVGEICKNISSQFENVKQTKCICLTKYNYKNHICPEIVTEFDDKLWVVNKDAYLHNFCILDGKIVLYQGNGWEMFDLRERRRHLHKKMIDICKLYCIHYNISFNIVENAYISINYDQPRDYEIFLKCRSGKSIMMEKDFFIKGYVDDQGRQISFDETKYLINQIEQLTNTYNHKMRYETSTKPVGDLNSEESFHMAVLGGTHKKLYKSTYFYLLDI